MNVPEAVTICLLLNSLLNMHYFFSAFQSSKGTHEAREECQTHATGKDAGKMCPVWRSLLNLSCLCSPEKQKITPFMQASC